MGFTNYNFMIDFDTSILFYKLVSNKYIIINIITIII